MPSEEDDASRATRCSASLLAFPITTREPKEPNRPKSVSSTTILGGLCEAPSTPLSREIMVLPSALQPRRECKFQKSSSQVQKSSNSQSGTKPKPLPSPSIQTTYIYSLTN